MTLNIPLEKIPHVSALNVTACGKVTFYRRRESDEAPVQPSSSSLRELQLHSCQNMDVGGLQRAVQSLKDAGAWDKLDRVVIKKCNLLDYDATVEVIGKERLHFSEL